MKWDVVTAISVLLFSDAGHLILVLHPKTQSSCGVLIRSFRLPATLWLEPCCSDADEENYVCYQDSMGFLCLIQQIT